MNRGPLHHRLLSSVLLAAAALGLAACGGGSSGTNASSTTTNPGARSGGFFAAARDPKVQACLKKQGVTLPTGRFRGGNGQPPARTTPGGAPRNAPNGTPPGRRFGNSAQFQKLRAALEKCGVQLPSGPPGGAPPGGASGTSTGTTSVPA
jgi:hypothetical protein